MASYALADARLVKIRELEAERDQLRKDLAASGDFNARVVDERDGYRRGLELLHGLGTMPGSRDRDEVCREILRVTRRALTDQQNGGDHA